MRWTLVVLLFEGLLLLAGCPGTEQTCEPGGTQECTCAGGASGGQVCADDGLRWNACDCGTGDDDDAADDDATGDDDVSGDDDATGDGDDTSMSEEDFWTAMTIFLCQQVLDCWPETADHYGWVTVEDCLPLMSKELANLGCVFTGVNADGCLEGLESMDCVEFEHWLYGSGACMDALDCPPP